MDSNLLKEAIADAKAVRQTALANAKVALEEAFSERYQAMFAEKLKEEAEQQEVSPSAEETGRNPEENVSEQEIDELIKELEAEVGDQDNTGEVPPAPAVPDTSATLPQVPQVPAVPVVGTPSQMVPPTAPGAQCFPAGTTTPPSGLPGSPLGVGSPQVPVVPPTPELPNTSAGIPPSDVPSPEEETDEEFDDVI